MIRPFISRLGPPEKGFRDGRRPGSQRVVEVLFVTYSALVAILNAHAAQAVHPSAVKNRVPLGEMPKVQRMIKDAEQQLAGSGRLLVRYSGTEMLARVMIEGEDPAEIGALAREIGAAIGQGAGRAKERAK